MSETFIQFKEITKTFGGVVALKEVTLDVARGECHGLMGENGAGKSTLGKVLAGIHKPDSGEMHIDGKLYHFNSPRDAMDAGVAMVHQELAFCKDLSVAENLSMGHEVINLSTRILVMRDGNLAGELSRQEASQESVLRLMAGVASPTAKAA
jgi:ABC-type sugar transport system ATPase subunit